MKRKKRIYTIEQLRALIPMYQKRLKLNDWEIDISFVPYESIMPHLAEITHEFTNQWAHIAISTPESVATSQHYPFDMKHTLIHEMMHLVFPFFHEFEGVKHDLMELGINRIADILVNVFEDPPV